MAPSPAALPPASPDGALFDEAVAPFLKTHCMRCHGEKEQKGELRIDTLSRDFAASGAAVHWGDVAYRISTGEMPPEPEPQPSADEAARVAEFLDARLKEGESARLAKRERVTFHKLTREEYANTIFDLLGIRFDPGDPNCLPEDPNWHGFERIGSVLSLSPAHVERYFAAADAILDEALPDKPPAKLALRWLPSDFHRINGLDELKAKGLFDKIRLDVWAGSTFTGHPGSNQALQIPSSGEYIGRVKLSGFKPPTGRAPHVVIYSSDLDRMLFEQDVIAPEDQPVTLEFRTHLPAGPHLLRLCNEVPAPSNLGRLGRSGAKPFFSIKQGRFPWQRKLTDEEGVALEPFLIVDWVEWEGPVTESQPTTIERQYGLVSDADAAQAKAALGRFIERAFRRPARSEEVEDFTRLMDRELSAGETVRGALCAAMLAVLCSKDFIYLVEGSPSENAQDQLLGTRLAAVVFPLEHDARRIAARGRARWLARPSRSAAGSSRAHARRRADFAVYERLCPAMASVAPSRPVPAR